MNEAKPTSLPVKGLIVASCVGVLICIFVAGLWPFRVPHNAVSWQGDENGLYFDRHGSVVSVNPFHPTRASDATGYSLEMWLTPGRVLRGATILAFDSSPDPWWPFKVRQYESALVVQRYYMDDHGKARPLWFKTPNVCKENTRVFVTISSGEDRTDLYVNGALAGTSDDPGITSRELTGRLVLANSVTDDSWRGAISGLAIYSQELSAAQVANHYQYQFATGNNFSPEITPEKESLIALYKFNERAGTTIHNQMDAATDLTIPEDYFVLHRGFLKWDLPRGLNDFKRPSTWRTTSVNVLGFIPVGFVFYACFTAVWPVSRARLIVVLLGLLLSLIIETSQWLLPNRDSGLYDLVTNTAGTALGVLLYRYSSLGQIWISILEHISSVAGGVSLPSPQESGKQRLRQKDDKALSGTFTQGKLDG